jgi:hypothetical protein
MYHIVALVIILIIAIMLGSRRYPKIEHFIQQENVVLPKSKIAIACLMRKPIDLAEWLKHHRDIGIVKFYIRLEDSPTFADYLDIQPDVSYISSESDKDGNNYETLQTRQGEYVNKCLQDAAVEGIDWIFHIDADELLHGDLSFLDDLDAKYKCIKIQNAEAIFDEGQDSCFAAKRFLKCHAGAPCKSYVNGKAAGRVHQGVFLNGPHAFAYNGSGNDGEAGGSNYTYDVPFEKLHLLHYDACTFGSWAEKYIHLAKTDKKKDIPFAYYKDSIDAVEKAYKIYKEYKMPTSDSIDANLLYSLE